MLAVVPAVLPAVSPAVLQVWPPEAAKVVSVPVAPAVLAEVVALVPAAGLPVWEEQVVVPVRRRCLLEPW